MKVYFHHRLPHKGAPGGITVSKTAKLPDGDFRIDEFTWHTVGASPVSLWFIADQKFTADEREASYVSFMSSRHPNFPRRTTRGKAKNHGKA